MSRTACMRPAALLAPLALGLVVLVGCSSTAPKPPAQAAQTDAQRQAEFDKSMDRWHGAHVQELLKKQGAPSSQSRLPGGKLVYVYERTTQLRGPNGVVPFRCVVRYTVDERSSLVVSHRIEGC